MSLNEQLEQMRQVSWGRWPAEKLAVVIRARDELARSGLTDRILGVGDHAPDFALPSSLGGTVRLADLLHKGPLVVAFYRGHW
ncbi:MAG: redoxin domain-containing protein [Planctomycetota bacterium]